MLLLPTSYSLLREKEIIYYKTKWRSPSTSEKGFRQAIRLKVPMTRLFIGILTKENGQGGKKGEKEHASLLKGSRTSIINKKWVLPQ